MSLGYYDSAEYLISEIEALTDIKTNTKTYELFRKLKHIFVAQTDVIESLEHEIDCIQSCGDDYD